MKFGNHKICIDSTHATNQYDFHLTTIIVEDEFGNGFPVSFCFSRKKDTGLGYFFLSNGRKSWNHREQQKFILVTIKKYSPKSV